MILKYHEEIFITLQNYFDDIKFKYVNRKLLDNGLHYPDIPCGTLVKTKFDTIKWLNYNPCKTVFPLLYLFFENIFSSIGLSELVNSHRGRQAIGHAMTPDDKFTVEEVKNKIIRRLEILYMLALNDTSLLEKCYDKCKECYSDGYMGKTHYACIKHQPNIFWLGMILHCIEDSYSRVHTLRRYIELKDYSRLIMEQDLKKYFDCKRNYIGGGNNDFTTKELSNKSTLIIRLIGNMINKYDYNKLIMIIDNIKKNEDILIREILAELPEKFSNEDKNKIKDIIKKNPDDINHMLKLVLFFKQQKWRIKTLFNNELPSNYYQEEISKIPNNNTDKFPPRPNILSFRYIPHQQNCGKSFHMSYDTKESTCEYNLDFFKKYDVHYILNMYKHHINDNSKPIQDKIYEFVLYISKFTFFVENDYRNNPSAIKCNIGKKCECELGLGKVIENHEIAISNLQEMNKQNEEIKQKYNKYKIKYDKLKNNNYI